MNRRKGMDFAIKLLIILAAYGFVAYKLRHSEDLQDSVDMMQNKLSESWPLFLVLFILMLLNWSVEALKWRYLLKDFYPLPFFTSLKSVMSGVSVGIFTPNRIGEFGGRIMYLPGAKRTEGSVRSLIGSYSQFFVTILFGIPALLIFVLLFRNGIFDEENLWPAVILSVVTACLLMLIYFRLTWVYALLQKLPFLKKYLEKLRILKDICLKDLLILIAFSTLRYAIFALQFYLILRLFGVGIGIGEMLVAMANLYFLMSLLPMFTIGEPGLRGSLSILFFGVFTPGVAGVVSASLAVWVINVIFAALLGALFLLNQKILNS